MTKLVTMSDICSVSKAAGSNSIPTSILKSNIDQLIDPITSILNKSLAEGNFPDLIKLASVCPIYKKKMIALNALIIDLFRFCQI